MAEMTVPMVKVMLKYQQTNILKVSQRNEFVRAFKSVGKLKIRINTFLFIVYCIPRIGRFLCLIAVLSKFEPGLEKIVCTNSVPTAVHGSKYFKIRSEETQLIEMNILISKTRIRYMRMYRLSSPILNYTFTNIRR